jgi:hypothetical protein
MSPLSMPGDVCGEALEYSLLQCDEDAVRSLLRRPGNRLTPSDVDRVMALAGSLQYVASCTFTFTGLSHPVQQHT